MKDQVRYILFCMDGRFHQHQGIIVPNVQKARDEASDFLNAKLGTNMIIASFLDNPDREYIDLHKVEIINSRMSQKKLNQLDLFNTPEF